MSDCMYVSSERRLRTTSAPVLLLLFIVIRAVVASRLLALGDRGGALVVLHRHVALVGRDLYFSIYVSDLELSPRIACRLHGHVASASRQAIRGLSSRSD